MIKEKNERVLHLVLNKALCGCAQSALLWLKLLEGALIDLAFPLNPHNPCVPNAEIEGIQCTIVCHVDDNKMSDKSINVMKIIVMKLEEKW